MERIKTCLDSTDHSKRASNFDWFDFRINIGSLIKLLYIGQKNIQPLYAQHLTYSGNSANEYVMFLFWSFNVWFKFHFYLSIRIVAESDLCYNYYRQFYRCDISIFAFCCDRCLAMFVVGNSKRAPVNPNMSDSQA